MITKKLLEEMFDYNPDTGVLTWKQRPVSHFKTETGSKIFNTKYSGKVAGHISTHALAGYVHVGINGKLYTAHRVIYMMVVGNWPKEIDHINGDRADNRWCNIREVDRLTNNKNIKRRADNKSGVTGVYWFDKTNRWMCYIDHEGSRIHLGYFKSKEEAITARKTAEVKYNYHDNHGRN